MRKAADEAGWVLAVGVVICFLWPFPGITLPHTGLVFAGQELLQLQQGRELPQKLHIQTGSNGTS